MLLTTKWKCCCFFSMITNFSYFFSFTKEVTQCISTKLHSCFISNIATDGFAIVKGIKDSSIDV